MDCVRRCLFCTLIGGAVVGSYGSHPPVTEYVFSRWYGLDFDIANSSLVSCLEDMSRVSSELSNSLSAKLSVPASVFLIPIPTTSSPLSINLSLSQHNIPGLHYRLCRLPIEYPALRICGEDLELIRVRQDRNQHLYIRNQEVITD